MHDYQTHGNHKFLLIPWSSFIIHGSTLAKTFFGKLNAICDQPLSFYCSFRLHGNAYFNSLSLGLWNFSLPNSWHISSCNFFIKPVRHQNFQASCNLNFEVIMPAPTTIQAQCSLYLSVSVSISLSFCI